MPTGAPKNDQDQNWGRYLGIGLEIAVGVALGYFVGNWLDRRYQWNGYGTLGGVMLARRNLRLGRGDRAGASKVALLVFVAYALARLCQADHVASFGQELWVLIKVLAYPAFWAGLVWLLYMALEPYARRRWPLADCLVIHRYGRLQPGDRIVLVATASAHRKAALEACQFLIDWLKTQAPFWKLEESPSGEARWVEAKESDDRAAQRWSRTRAE